MGSSVRASEMATMQILISFSLMVVMVSALPNFQPFPILPTPLYWLLPLLPILTLPTPLNCLLPLLPILTLPTPPHWLLPLLPILTLPTPLHCLLPLLPILTLPTAGSPLTVPGSVAHSPAPQETPPASLTTKLQAVGNENSFQHLLT